MVEERRRGGATFLPRLSLNPLNLQIKALDGSRQSKVQYAGSLIHWLESFVCPLARRWKSLHQRRCTLLAC